MVTQGGQLLNTNQIVVSNQNLAQQLASGKATLATIQGQQVLIRAASGNTLSPGGLQVQGGTNLVLKTQTGTTPQTVKVVKGPTPGVLTKVQGSPLKTIQTTPITTTPITTPVQVVNI